MIANHICNFKVALKMHRCIGFCAEAVASKMYYTNRIEVMNMAADCDEWTSSTRTNTSSRRRVR